VLLLSLLFCGAVADNWLGHIDVTQTIKVLSATGRETSFRGRFFIPGAEAISPPITEGREIKRDSRRIAISIRRCRQQL
jgi:hypothetical protein